MMLVIPRKKDNSFIVRLRVNEVMKRVFNFHDASLCNGYTICVLFTAHIYYDKTLQDLWFVFDYEIKENELFVISKDKEALLNVINKFQKIVQDIDCVKMLKENIDNTYRDYFKVHKTFEQI